MKFTKAYGSLMIFFDKSEVEGLKEIVSMYMDTTFQEGDEYKSDKVAKSLEEFFEGKDLKKAKKKIKKKAKKK